MIPITTPKGEFRVWTKRVGNNPDLKLLLLHGGPGATHEYFEAADSFLPAAGVEYYYYDQLGSVYSDNPADDDLWDLERFVHELEQVRVGLGIDAPDSGLPGHPGGPARCMAAADWPDPVNRGFRINQQLYVSMQGPSELGLSGKLSDWDRTEDLARIQVPTLVIGAQHDTMDPEWMRMMATRLPRGRYLHCPNGSHMAMYDDQETYFGGLIDFLHGL